MFKKLCIVFLIAITLLSVWNYPASSQAAESFDTADVDGFVTNYLERNGLPGASIVVVKDGEVVYEKGYGHDSEGNPITEKSLMRIGSVSKSFTAFAVLQLVEEGEIQLDDQIAKHLPAVEFDDPRWEEVTVRQLLSHTSGIPNPTIVASANNLKEGVERLHDWKLQSQPGKKYAYSNANYWILACLVEEISEKEFQEYLKQKIFSPLGMDDSSTIAHSRDSAKKLPNGYVTVYGTAIPWNELERMDLGNGGVVTTASDMGKWLSMHTHQGKSELGKQLLSKELLRESYSPQLGSEKYGLGWQLSSQSVKPARISHSGADTTYQAQQDIVPSSGYAVAVLLNSYTPTYEHAYEISSGIIQLTEGNNPEKKAPSSIIIDLSLGLITLIYLALGVRGILRSRKWSDKRKQYPVWKFYLRLIPQLIPVIGIGWLFFIVPTLKNNNSTTIDVFGVFPAAMILLAITFIVGLALTILRVYYRQKIRN